MPTATKPTTATTTAELVVADDGQLYCSTCVGDQTSTTLSPAAVLQLGDLFHTLGLWELACSCGRITWDCDSQSLIERITHG